MYMSFVRPTQATTDGDLLLRENDGTVLPSHAHRSYVGGRDSLECIFCDPTLVLERYEVVILSSRVRLDSLLKMLGCGCPRSR